MTSETAALPAHLSIEPGRLVFVGGLHRSGTTPLTRMLADHPQVAGLRSTGVEEDEGQHLQSVYPIARTYGGAGRFALDRRAHLTEASAVRTDTTAEQLLRCWAPYWDLSRQFLVEKSPPNLIMGRFLQDLFPGSCLIVVLRNPVIVALSTKKWARWTSLSELVRHWFVAHQTLRDDAEWLDRLLVLRYEDLVDEPCETLTRVASFLGLTGEIPHQSLDPRRSLPYVRRWEQMAHGGPVQRHRRRVIEDAFGDEMAGYGYSMRDLTRHTPWSWA